MSTTDQEVRREVARLRGAFRSGRTRPTRNREAQLDGVIRLLSDNEDEWAHALAVDLGRERFEAFTGDIAPPLIEARFARRNVRRWVRDERVAVGAAMFPGRARIRREPLGVVAVLGPWNYPIYLTIAPLVAAIAAGNTVIVKPSEHAPATAGLLGGLAPHYLDPDVVSVVTGDASTASTIIDGGIDHVFFTGGARAGAEIRQSAAERGIGVTLELGGKCPVVVMPDSDLDVAARRIADVKLWNAGQVCVGPDFVLVHESVRDALVERLVTNIHRMAVGGTQRVVNAAHYARIAQLLEGHGGTIATGGAVDPDAMTVEPTIIVDPTPDASILSEEIFGPVLPVVSVGSLDDAIDYIAARPEPLAVYAFSRDTSIIEQIAAGTRSGAVVVNELAYQLGNTSLPFGGIGASGTGAYHGRWGFDQLTYPRTILARSSRPDPSFRYRPRTTRQEKLIRLML